MDQDNTEAGAVAELAEGTFREYLRGEAGPFGLHVLRTASGFAIVVSDPAGGDETAEAPTFAEAWLTLRPPPPDRRIDLGAMAARAATASTPAVGRPELERSFPPVEQALDLLRRRYTTPFDLSIAMRAEGEWSVRLAGHPDPDAPWSHGPSFAEAWQGRPDPAAPRSFGIIKGGKD